MASTHESSLIAGRSSKIHNLVVVGAVDGEREGLLGYSHGRIRRNGVEAVLQIQRKILKGVDCHNCATIHIPIHVEKEECIGHVDEWSV